ncbi:MAG: response regulator, partial [Shimia sp.]|nr:response regulator [Shimia sp.]
PTHLHGDWHKLRHVLMNLLSNALKFTKQGTVTPHVSRMADKTDTQAHLLFEVIDTGCGISETAEDTLFEPFVQTGAPASVVPAGGSGLGLAISRHLVDFLGGQISYRPNPAGGSIFSFDLTFDVAQKPALFPENATGHHILVVEDDPVNAIVIEGYLTELGNTVTQVDTYDDAVAALETEQIEIVVTDFKLGAHTGLDVEEAASRIAQDRGIDIPVLLVTAAIPMDAVQRLNHRDTASVLQKPFSRTELATALSTICKHALSHKTHVPKRKIPALSRKDLNRLLSDLGFERCDSVVRSFQTNLPSMISGMQAKLNKQDIAGLRELLHRLVSASGFVGGKHLVEMTVSLSQACKQQDHATIQTRFDDLKSEGAALLAELEDWRQATLATR